MPHFMFQGTYTSESMLAMIQSPEDRSRLIRGVIEKLGGRLEGFWLAFGQSDFVLICQMPNDQAAAAFAMAAVAGGGIRTGQTTALLTWEEAINAMTQAAQAGYTPPKRPGT